MIYSEKVWKIIMQALFYQYLTYWYGSRNPSEHGEDTFFQKGPSRPAPTIPHFNRIPFWLGLIQYSIRKLQILNFHESLKSAWRNLCYLNYLSSLKQTLHYTISYVTRDTNFSWRDRTTFCQRVSISGNMWHT